MSKHTDKITAEYSKALRDNTNSIVKNTAKAKFAQYDSKKLSKFAADITDYSFGCGDPLSFAQVEKGQTVVDLGCGAGLDLLIATEKVGTLGHVIGVDINPDMLEIARNRTVQNHNVTLHQAYIENLPIPSSSIDWVISNCVINLSASKQSVFNEIARTLKPDGQMLVSDMVAEQLPWWLKYSGIMTAACGGNLITEQRYLNGLKTAGLTNSKIVARHYYSAEQLAAIVSDSMPTILQTMTCCGKKILNSFLNKLAKPISTKLWSVKIYANKAI